MTVRAPRMEGEQGAQHAKSQEGEWEPDALLFNRYVVQGGYFGEVHRGGAATVVDAQDAYQQEGRTAHQHQRQLHGGVFLAARTPYADEQIHRYQGHFIEHEHGEQVDGNKETEHAQ